MKATEIKKGFKFYIKNNGEILACRVRQATIVFKVGAKGYFLDDDYCPMDHFLMVCETPYGLIEIKREPGVGYSSLKGDSIYATPSDVLKHVEIPLYLNNTDVLDLLKDSGCHPDSVSFDSFGGSDRGCYMLWTLNKTSMKIVQSSISEITTDGEVFIYAGGPWYNTKEECEAAEFPKIKVVDFVE